MAVFLPNTGIYRIRQYSARHGMRNSGNDRPYYFYMDAACNFRSMFGPHGRSTGNEHGWQFCPVLQDLFNITDVTRCCAAARRRLRRIRLTFLHIQNNTTQRLAEKLDCMLLLAARHPHSLEHSMSKWSIDNHIFCLCISEYNIDYDRVPNQQTPRPLSIAAL